MSSSDLLPGARFLLRSPLLSWDELEAWAGTFTLPAEGEVDALNTAITAHHAAARARLDALVSRPEVLEALFLASPDLVASLPAWRAEPASKKGKKTERSLLRYLLRMATRSTPFGLFAGFTTATGGEETRLELAARRECTRHSRLDMDLLFAAIEQLTRERELLPALCYVPNASLYCAAGRQRYAEVRLRHQQRTYHLVAVDDFEALSQTLERAAGGVSIGTLAEALMAADEAGEITLDEATAFVHDLIENQLLLPTLALAVTGPEGGPVLAAELAALPAAAAAAGAAALARAQAELAALDRGGLGALPERYHELAAGLEPLGVARELGRLVQVDLRKKAVTATLSEAVLAEVARAVTLLHQLTPPAERGPLTEFRSAFVERYGEAREVPLLEVLDEELGLGFGRAETPMAEASPLFAGLPLSPRRRGTTIPWGSREATLLRLIDRAQARGELVVELSAADLEALEDRDRLPLPDSIHAMVTVVAPSAAALAEGGFRLLFTGASGPSGARLLGRFCHADPELLEGVRQLLAAEETHHPAALFAEVVHLPAGRIGNVLARPVLRAYEIPFLGRSGAPVERQIPVADLVVTVLGERVVLRSLSLGREVIPRLTTAHNTTRESLGVYRFLAALQTQGLASGIEWRWDPLQSMPFVPRISSGRTVLCRAHWRLFADEIHHLTSVAGAERYRRAGALRRERRIPRFAELVDGDNELLVDFENPLLLDVACELIKGHPEALLTELFPGPDELCATGPEGRFFHELVIPFVRRPPAVQQRDPITPRPAPARLRRTFAPGSEWLFAKLYTGTATADRILVEEVAPLVAEARAAGLIDRFFFIRYGDPQWHLRLRFGGRPEVLARELRPRLEDLFSRLLDQGMTWKAQLDTYDRETERYGGPAAISLAEEIFCHDSDAVLALLNELAGDAGAEDRWRLMLLGMDHLLRDFGLDLEARRELAQRARDGFARRYETNGLRGPVADRLRRERAALTTLLRGEATAGELEAARATLAARSRALAPAISTLHELAHGGLLNQPVSDIVPSLLHMFVNRLARSHGPEHELVLYDFLVQLYGSELARTREPKEK